MREIEIKVRVQSEEDLLLKFASVGVVLTAPVKHHDVVYGEKGAFGGELGSRWLRVRTENDSRVIFNLKRSVTGQLDSIEHEVVVDNADEIRAIIAELGFELYSDLTKTRQKGKVGDVELCFDKVEGLGVFLELEKLVDQDAQADSVLEELWKIAASLGLSRDDNVTDGYDVLMRKALNSSV